MGPSRWKFHRSRRKRPFIRSAISPGVVGSSGPDPVEELVRYTINALVVDTFAGTRRDSIRWHLVLTPSKGSSMGACSIRHPWNLGHHRRFRDRPLGRLITEKHDDTLTIAPRRRYPRR